MVTRSPERAESIERALNDPMNHFLRWRMLSDGTYVGMIQLLFTVAIVTDLNECGYSNRFCFDNPELALSEYDRLVDGDSEPVGWIARR